MMEKLKNKLNLLPKAIVIIIGILVISSFIQGFSLIQKSDRRIEEAKKRVEEDQARQEEIKKELEEVSSDFFTEQTARDKLGLAKPGETVVVLPDKETLRKLAPQRQVEEEGLPDPNWRRWLKLFL